MPITNIFINAVESNDILSIRLIMKNSLLSDLTFQNFDDMTEYVKNLEGLYDIHDNKNFILDSAGWNSDYMNTLMVEVVDNFSKERLEHLKQVVRHLYPAPKVGSTASSNDSMRSNNVTKSYKTQKAEDAKNGKIIKMCSGAALGAGIGYGVATLIEAPVVIGVVVGAVVVGTAVAVISK